MRANDAIVVEPIPINDCAPSLRIRKPGIFVHILSTLRGACTLASHNPPSIATFMAWILEAQRTVDTNAPVG